MIFRNPKYIDVALTLDGATIEFSAPMEEVDAYVRQHSWVIATTSSGTISARDLLEARHSFRWRNTGKVLKAISPGFTVLVL